MVCIVVSQGVVERWHFERPEHGRRLHLARGHRAMPNGAAQFVPTRERALIIARSVGTNEGEPALVVASIPALTAHVPAVSAWVGSGASGGRPPSPGPPLRTR